VEWAEWAECQVAAEWVEWVECQVAADTTLGERVQEMAIMVMDRPDLVVCLDLAAKVAQTLTDTELVESQGEEWEREEWEREDTVPAESLVAQLPKN
jgi:hypothetical protein